MNTEDKLEFQQQWSSAAGRLASMQIAEKETRQWACRAFGEGRDEIAREFRSLARHFEKQAELLSADVQEFIKQAQTRS